MKTGIVVSFTGSRGTEIPLLYYTSKHYADLGYDTLLVDCKRSADGDFDKLYEKVQTIIKSIDFGEYEHIVFASKSIGTYISCKLKEELNISAELILFTPIEETLPYIRKDNAVKLVAAGDEDAILANERLVEWCESQGIECHVEHGVGHRMEVVGNLTRNLEIVNNVLSGIFS